MEETIIRCKKVLGGLVTGEALVSHVPISFVGEIDEATGVVRPKGHELEGMSVADKIIVYPEAKGSTFVGVTLEVMAYFKCQPKAIVMVKEPDHATIQGIIVTNIPAVCLPDKDPLKLIATGDLLEVNATEGIVTVKKKI